VQIIRVGLAILTCISKQFVCIWPYGDATCTLSYNGCICPYACAVFSVKLLSQIHTAVLDTNRNSATPLKQGQNEQQTRPHGDHWTSISRALPIRHQPTRKPSKRNDHPSTHTTRRGKRSSDKKNETSRAPNAPRTRITPHPNQTKGP